MKLKSFSNLAKIIFSGVLIIGCATTNNKPIVKENTQKYSNNLMVDVTSHISKGEKVKSYGTTSIDENLDGNPDLININLNIYASETKERIIQEIYKVDYKTKTKSKYPLITLEKTIERLKEENGKTTINTMEIRRYDCGSESIKEESKLPPILNFKPDGITDLTVMTYESVTTGTERPQKIEPYIVNPKPRIKA